jgi:hypothetical protein
MDRGGVVVAASLGGGDVADYRRKFASLCSGDLQIFAKVRVCLGFAGKCRGLCKVAKFRSAKRGGNHSAAFFVNLKRAA